MAVPIGPQGEPQGEPLRILAVTPIHVDDAELQRRAARYARLAPPGVRVSLRDLGPEAPRALDTPGDIERSTELMAEAVLAGAREEADVFLPDCVLDPAVPVAAAARSAGLPVLGLLRTCLGLLWGAGRTFGGVARNPVIAAELDRKIAGYGLAHAYTGTEVLDLDVAAIADDERWNRAMAAALDRLADRGADAVINGCSAVDIAPGTAAAIDVIDPAALALGAIGLGAGAGGRA